jgi:hypothetical protein
MANIDKTGVAAELALDMATVRLVLGCRSIWLRHQSSRDS